MPFYGKKMIHREDLSLSGIFLLGTEVCMSSLERTFAQKVYKGDGY